jgi:proteasome lid subunit RPN8/RPN11
MLCKQGIRELTLIDKDRFSPHNPARHVLGKCYTEMPKVFGLSSFLTRHYHPEKITPLLDEIGSPSINVNELMQEKLFVDCTANPNVADVIDTIARAEPAVKCYISMAGRVGILLSKSSRETFFDLEVLGYYAAVENSEITEWLLNDGVLGLTTLGIGCGSDTFELPYATISSHNSVFQTLINKKLRNADSNGIHINFLDENFLPAKYIEVEVPEFKEFNPIDEAHEWTIALSSRARNTIENSTKLCQPNEAAGYLLGSFNARIKRITIVAATHVDQQMPSPTNANLPPVSQDNIAMDILNKTNSLIVPVGTWHSHPAGSAQPSLKDKGTFSGLINLLGDNPQPYVMLISNGEQEQTTSLIIPEKWH